MIAVCEHARVRRGEVREYAVLIQRPGVALRRLIVSSEPITAADDLAVVLSLQVYDDDRGLLSVRVGNAGYASALAPEASLRSRMGQVVHVLTEDEQASVDAALRAALDL